MNASNPQTLPMPGPTLAPLRGARAIDDLTPASTTDADALVEMSTAPDAFRVLPHGDEVFRLADAGDRTVGWIRRSAIRLGTFATERDAVEAALVGGRVLDGQLHEGMAAPAVASDCVQAHEVSHGARLIHDGAYEWVVLGQRLVARLIRPVPPPFARGTADAAPAAGRRDPLPDHAAFSLEFVVPASVTPATRPSVARALHRAMAQHAIAPTANVVHDALGRPLIAARRALADGSAVTPASGLPQGA